MRGWAAHVLARVDWKDVIPVHIEPDYIGERGQHNDLVRRLRRIVRAYQRDGEFSRGHMVLRKNLAPRWQRILGMAIVGTARREGRRGSRGGMGMVSMLRRIHSRCSSSNNDIARRCSC